MPNGQNSNSVVALDVNTQGDVLFQYSNGVNSMVVRRGGKLRRYYEIHESDDSFIGFAFSEWRRQGVQRWPRQSRQLLDRRPLKWLQSNDMSPQEPTFGR